MAPKTSIFGKIKAFKKTVAIFNFRALIPSSDNLAKDVDEYGVPRLKEMVIPLKVSIQKTIGVKPTPQTEINSSSLALSVECFCVQPVEVPLALSVGSTGVGQFKGRKCTLTIDSFMIQPVGEITHGIVGEKFVGSLLFVTKGGVAGA